MAISLKVEYIGFLGTQQLKMERNLNNNNREIDLETPAISALAAASKTPFWTAFKVTIGIGLARLVMFAGVVGTLILLYKILMT